MKKPSQANNGNIAETHWRSAYDHLKRGYAYKYDNLNRLKEAHYLRGGFFNNSYNEFVDYDKNGNITSLYRTGMVEDGSNPMVIDQLTYTYANNGLSNKLMKVTDAPNANRDYGFKDDSDGTNDIEDDYSYDTYGNMTSDQNKGILLIDYNHLNLPTRIRFNNGYQIEYLYNAAGVKLAKTVIEQTTTTTVYMNGYQYIDDKLQFFPQAEGYVKFTEGNNNQEFFNYIYQYKDHLGNNRVSYTIDPSDNVLKILTHDHYYPFGMKHQGYSNFVSDVRPPPGLATLMVMDVNDLAYKYKYNGKEWQDELGLNFYDYHARNYDPAIGRWMNPDPLAEEAYNWTLYRFGFNNPIRFNDPTGLSEEDWIPGVDDTTGAVSYTAEKGDSAKTLSSQYGISQEKAEKITGTEGSEEIKEGTKVSGEKVKQVTGSEVLKLDLDSKEGKSQQRRFDHFMFASDHSKTQGAWGFFTTDYFSNTQYKETLIGKAVLKNEGESFIISYRIPFYRSATFDGSGTRIFISNTANSVYNSVGKTFPNNQANIKSNIYHPKTANQMGYFEFYVHRKNADNAYSRFNKKFPEYRTSAFPQKID